eukprot:8725-Heterococcus_DN1.PRE.4
MIKLPCCPQRSCNTEAEQAHNAAAVAATLTALSTEQSITSESALSMPHHCASWRATSGSIYNSLAGNCLCVRAVISLHVPHAKACTRSMRTRRVLTAILTTAV